MSSSTVSDVLTRISAIQQQLQSLQSGSLLAAGGGSSAASAASAGAGPSAVGPSSAGPGAPAAFADQLAQAQQTAGGAAIGLSAASSPTSASLLESVLGGAAAPGGASAGGASYAGAVTGGAGIGATASPAASSQLTQGQQQFAATLSADTGLNPNVVSAWLLAEESGGAAQSRQAAGNNDWLNIGYTDSGTYGSGDPVWSDPVSAANATAAWLQGQNSIPGYGTASPGIQSILQSVGQTPEAQIQAIQTSGWSSGGYPSLGALYQQVTSAGTATVSGGTVSGAGT